MANTPRNASITVDEVADVVSVTREHLRLLEQVLEDDVVTLDEARAVFTHARHILQEALEAAHAAEITDVGELLTLSSLKAEVPSPALVKRAERLGMATLIRLPQRSTEPRPAA